MLYALDGKAPIHDPAESWVADTAAVVGDVVI